MSYIWPIVKKNFVLVKRNIIKFIFQVIYPSLLVLVYGIIMNLSKSEKNTESEKQLYEIYTINNNYMKPVEFYDNTALIGNKFHVDNLEALLKPMFKKCKRIN